LRKKEKKAFGRPRFRSPLITDRERQRILRAFYLAVRLARLKPPKKPPISRRSTAPPKSRQRAWQRRNVDAGKCANCGRKCDFNAKRGKVYYYCAKCRVEMNQYQAQLMRQRRAAARLAARKAMRGE